MPVRKVNTAGPLEPERSFEPTHSKRVLMALAYYEHRMHRGVARYASEANWVLDTRMVHYGSPPEDWRGDGILALALPDRADLSKFLRKARVPIVGLTNDVAGVVTARVVLDNFLIGRIAAEHLLERGFRNLAFFKCTDYADIREREAGFATAVREAGLTYTCVDWHCTSGKKPQQQLLPWLARQLTEMPTPLGIMAQSDHRAYVVINACESAELSIPDQVTVVGVDNDELTCQFAPVPISSVDSNREELAYRGAEVLGQLMQGSAAPESPIIISPRGLVQRRSSDILAIEHPEIARALAFIWQHYGKSIKVQDVVRETRVSRCSLYRSFEKYVGRTIRQELERKRLECAQRLLLTTRNKVSHIARQSGFSSGEQFCRVFARSTGQTPSAFRRAHSPRPG